MTDDNIIDLAAPYGRKKDGTPKKPPGFARGGAVFKSPASGIPAGGFIASPPKGVGAGPEALIPGSGPEKRALGDASRINREEAAERALGRLMDIMDDPDTPPATVVQAADKVISHSIGSPVQRVVSTTLDDIQRMQDDELRAELERLEGITRAADSTR